VEGYQPRPFGCEVGSQFPHRPRFPRPPVSSQTVGFPESGWRPWPIPSRPSHYHRGLSAGPHTPRTVLVCLLARHPLEHRVPGLNVPARVHSMPAMHREPLCPFRALPLRGWHLPPPGKALPFPHRSYGLMRQTNSLPLASALASLVGPCRLLPAPAGRWSFPTLSPQVFPQVPGPLPRWDPMVHSPVSSHRTSAFPRFLKGRLPHKPYSDFTTGVYFGAAVIPLCSGPRVCSPPRSLLPQP
jgi:hypothetical protein